MSEWQGMETAPKDGTWFQAEIPDHGEDNIIAWQWGFESEDGGDCGTWCFMTDQEPPDSWTDGVCWDSNEHCSPSVRPTRWKPLSKETSDG